MLEWTIYLIVAIVIIVVCVVSSIIGAFVKKNKSNVEYYYNNNADDEYYNDEEEYDNDYDEAENYVLILDRKQHNITRQQFNIVLKEASIKFNRREVYVDGDFENAVNGGRLFPFLVDEFNNCQEVKDYLYHNNVNSYILSNEIYFNSPKLNLNERFIEFKDEIYGNKLESIFQLDKIEEVNDISNSYSLIISPLQKNISKDSFENILIEVSVKYGLKKYESKDFEYSYLGGSEYIFMTSENRYNIQNVCDYLINNNINSFIKKSNNVVFNLDKSNRVINFNDIRIDINN
ncbi:MAG: hypothetical protein K2L64_02590 [Ureaplasma sp.]|nr:hypothetical protein [Ureaplasma sp.]